MATLLPNAITEFQSVDYWEQFFKQRGQDTDSSFEWYGDHAELGCSIQKYLKASDAILQLGCGDSVLADNLHDNGFQNITSIDVVADAIKRQDKRNQTVRPKLEFKVMDATQLTCLNESFNVVLDKGTLDALLPDDSNVDVVTRMFGEVCRVLKLGGRSVTVSLAQAHVVKTWINFFASETTNSYILRVHQVYLTSDSIGQPGSSTFPLPPFLLVATKLKLLPPSFPAFYEFVAHNGHTSKSPTPAQLQDHLKASQEYSLLCHRLQSKSLKSEECTLNLFSSESEDPKYQLVIFEHPKPSYCEGPFAVLIIPQGREHESIFSTVRGRLQLAQQTKFQRLVLVALGRSFQFDNLKVVMDELNDRVMDFAPKFLVTRGEFPQVPILSLGDDLGRRVVLCRMHSEINGNISVEDVYDEDDSVPLINRRLIFMSNQSLIQSESVMTDVNSGIIEFRRLSCHHHLVMLMSLACVTKPESLVLIGLGGGNLPAFLVHAFPSLDQIVVELDPVVEKIAREWFQLDAAVRNVPSSSVEIKVGDGVNYLRQLSYVDCPDIILLDVTGGSGTESGLFGPPSVFLDSELLEHLHNLLSQKHSDKPDQCGALVVNLVTRDEDCQEETLTLLKNHFDTVWLRKEDEDINSIVFCLPICDSKVFQKAFFKQE